MKTHLSVATCACLITIISMSVHAASVSGQGTWETTLQGRDLDGNTTTFEAYYDTILNITWLANANVVGSGLHWFDANGWVAGFDINRVSGWRLPTLSPINGSTFDTNFSDNATTDVGYANNTGWVDNSSNPVSEMGHMYYVTLGNLGVCTPNNVNPSNCTVQTGWGLSNTGPFTNLQSYSYWSSIVIDPEEPLSAWSFNFNWGEQDIDSTGSPFYAWAVHDGDINTVPVPSAVWLFGSGLIGLAGIARRRNTINHT